jgi:hypothetical protein
MPKGEHEEVEEETAAEAAATLASTHEMEDAEAAIREENRAYQRTAKRELRELERLASKSPTVQNLHALSEHRAMTGVFYDIYGAGEADEKESTEDTYDENDNEHRVAEEEEKWREKMNWIRATIALGGHRTRNGGLDVGEAKEPESTEDTYDENDNKPGIAAEEVLRREYDAQEDPRKLEEAHIMSPAQDAETTPTHTHATNR